MRPRLSRATTTCAMAGSARKRTMSAASPTPPARTWPAASTVATPASSDAERAQRRHVFRRAVGERRLHPQRIPLAAFGRLLARRDFELRQPRFLDVVGRRPGGDPACEESRTPELPTLVRLPPPCGTFAVAFSSSSCDRPPADRPAGRRAARTIDSWSFAGSAPNSDSRKPFFPCTAPWHVPALQPGG